MRSEINSGASVTFICILTSNLIAQPLSSCIFIVTSKGLTCPGISGCKGGRVLPLTAKIAKNWKKEGKIWGKEEKSGRKVQNRKGFFHFAPPDREGWLRYCLELTSDLIRTHLDLSRWCQTLNQFQSCFEFHLTWYNCLFA